MDDVLIGLGFLLVIEGLLYAALPDTMRRMIVEFLKLPEGRIRGLGLMAALGGLILIRMAKG